MKHQHVQDALMAFAAAFKGAKKTGFNPYHKSEHHTLGDIVKATRKELHEHGLFVIHTITENAVRTTVYHSDTMTSVFSEIPLPESSDPQKVGSAITYYKRYNLTCLLNISETDDDGQYASEAIRPLATAEQRAELKDFADADQLSDNMAAWLKKKGAHLTEQDAEQALINIKMRLEQQ